MATFGDILASSDTAPNTIADKPDIFMAFTTMGGVKTTYLLRGQLGDYDAEIIGRIEHVGGAVHPYRGNGLTGGEHGSAFSITPTE